MILQALTRYYEILTSDPDSGIAPPGYSTASVSFAVNLSAQGDLLDLFPLTQTVKRGNQTVEIPQRRIVPEQVKRSSGISPNFLCDSPAYVLAISGKEAKDPQYCQKRFEAFKELNLKLLEKTDSPAARAVAAFLSRYDPNTGQELPAIKRHLDDLAKGGNLVFMVDGSFAHEDPAMCQAWETYKLGRQAAPGQCLVSGETAPIARLHPSVKGVRDTVSTGATLVGFNAPAYESYHREQGLNSPVSEKAAFAYTTALNYLLSAANENQKFLIGDTTVVYWAESPQKEYANAFRNLFEPEWVVVEAPAEGQGARDPKAEKRMQEVGEKIRRAQALDIQRLMEGLDINTRFYILGLAPNAARISVRFFYQDLFGKTIYRIMRHYKDMEIEKEYEDQPTYLTIRQILDETVSKNASDPKAMPLLGGAVFRAILNNAPYPAALYNAVITRIRADQDNKEKRIKKINYQRAAIIKAYLTRKYRRQPEHPFKEVFCMSLNEKSTLPAYVLGRLFAVLEKVQQEAIPNANATIKDRYFTSACATPASVFPVLLRLSQHHISKAEYGYVSDRRIQDILNLLDIEKNPIPAHLSLDEQGLFVLGYYHQRAAFYVPGNSQKKAESTHSENQ